MIHVTVDRSAELPPLTAGQLDDLTSNRSRQRLLIPQQYSQQKYGRTDPLFLTWSTANLNEDPWFNVVDQNDKTVVTLGSKAEYDALYDLCAAQD